ncbi:MAG: pilus assembly protein TadG-related protein, partial [Nocardioides sp.]|nr:pilus assembly protein TadG-related protein [Nocardioides sp.]
MNRRRDERGAVAVFLGVSISLLVLIAAFAVDLGMQRVVRRDMQALADVVALDLARELDGRTRAQLASAVDATSPTSALSLSVARNSTTLGDPPVVAAELGAWDGTTFNALADPPTAVKVTASGSVSFAFRPGEGGATRTAIGSTIKSACYTMGSFAARFRTGDSALLSTLLEPMNELMRPQANIDALSYTGLANEFVTLDELAVAAGLGSTDQLLTSTITASELIEAAISVLQSRSTDNSVAIAAL